MTAADQLVLSRMALRNLLGRAFDGECPDDLVALCIANASAVRITVPLPDHDRDTTERE